MPRLHGMPKRAALALLPLLAATLACNALNGPAGAAPTQAAAASSAPPTALAVAPTQAPTAAPATLVLSPTSNPTTAPTQPAAASATPETAATATPAAADSGVEDPCTLISQAEAQTLAGVAVSGPQERNGGCLFADAATGITYGVTVYALPGAQSQNYLQSTASQMEALGASADPAAQTRLDQDIAAGDTVAAVNDLSAMAAGQAKFKEQKIVGLGSAALWLWNTANKLQQGILLAARPGALVSLSSVAGTAAQESAELPAMQALVGRILDGLPASFTVAGLQVAGSAPAIDPCALATASEVEALLGAKPGAGQAQQGQCQYAAATDPKVQLRVYALPAGVTASGVVQQMASQLTPGNARLQAQLEADLKANDLVAAVRHLSAAPASLFGKPESVDGLGDAALYFDLNVKGAPFRLNDLVAARPGVLVGLNLILGPGNQADTKTPGIAMLARILGSLPEKFIVSGAP